MLCLSVPCLVMQTLLVSASSISLASAAPWRRNTNQFSELSAFIPLVVQPSILCVPQALQTSCIQVDFYVHSNFSALRCFSSPMSLSCPCVQGYQHAWQIIWCSVWTTYQFCKVEFLCPGVTNLTWTMTSSHISDSPHPHPQFIALLYF